MKNGILKVGDLVKSKWRTSYNHNDYGIVVRKHKTKLFGYVTVSWTDGFFNEWQPEASLDLVSAGTLQ